MSAGDERLEAPQEPPPGATVVVSLRCTACGHDFPGTMPVAFVNTLAAAGITVEEVRDSIAGGLASQRIMCRACLSARAN